MSIPGKDFILLQFSLTMRAAAAILLLLVVKAKANKGSLRLAGTWGAWLLLAFLCAATGIFTMW